jgi:hypothetical protein
MKAEIITVLNSMGLYPVPNHIVDALEAHFRARLVTMLKTSITENLVATMIVQSWKRDCLEQRSVQEKTLLRKP